MSEGHCGWMGDPSRENASFLEAVEMPFEDPLAHGGGCTTGSPTLSNSC